MHVHYLFPCQISYPNSNGALIIAIRPKNKYGFHAASILFYILKNEIQVTK
jgi:hypothetical protein